MEYKMEYLSKKYMKRYIDDYCETKRCYTDCMLLPKCRRSFESERNREQAFLQLVLSELEEVQDEIPIL